MKKLILYIRVLEILLEHKINLKKLILLEILLIKLIYTFKKILFIRKF